MASLLIIFPGILITIMGWDFWVASPFPPYIHTPLGELGWYIFGRTRNVETLHSLGLFVFIVGIIIIFLGILQTSEPETKETKEVEEEDEEESE